MSRNRLFLAGIASFENINLQDPPKLQHLKSVALLIICRCEVSGDFFTLNECAQYFGKYSFAMDSSPPHKMGLIPLSEPVGGSAPKFASASKGSIFVHAEHEAIVQLCPAQASPLPTFR